MKAVLTGVVLVLSAVRESACSVLPSMTHLNPSWRPTTSTLSAHAVAATAAMTALMPGAGPPAQAMASFFLEGSVVVVTARILA